MTARLLEGDCLRTLPALESNSVDSCCTDPPYHLTSIVKRFGSANAAPAQFGTDGAFARASRGFMGKEWDGGDIAFRPEFWAEVLRVLKPGAHLVAFGASRGYHRMACAIEDAGFEIRDSLMWLYGTGFPKSHDVALDFETTLCERVNNEWRYKDDGVLLVKGEWRHPGAIIWDGFGTALKPAFEPIVLARKPLSEPTVAANVLRWRTGALNIDACRVETDDGQNRARPPRTANEILGGGKGTNLTASPHNDAGRWPANVVHDGSDEVVGAFPSAGGQQGRAKIGGEKKGSIYGDFGANQSTNPEPRGDSGSAARFFYSAKASKADRAGSKHPTVKPVALMQWLARLVTPPGGVIPDPFAGSGTTGAAALAEGFKAVLCEREPEYIADIKRRLGFATSFPWEKPPIDFPWQNGTRTDVQNEGFPWLTKS